MAPGADPLKLFFVKESDLGLERCGPKNPISLLCTRQGTGHTLPRTGASCQNVCSQPQPTNPEDDVRLLVSQWLPMLTVSSVTVEETWEPAYGQQDRILRIRVDYATPSQDTGSSYVALGG